MLPRLPFPRVWGTGAAAARQASLLFALVAALNVASILTHDTVRTREVVATVVASVVAAAIWSLPWQRWPPGATLLLAIPAFALLALSTRTLGGVGIGNGPFYVLAFVWIGLHHSARGVLLVTPPAAASYAAAVALSPAPSDVLGNVVLLFSVCVVVALIVADRVRKLQAARDEVRRAEAWRAALMSTLAHDVRSPLTAVQGVLEVLSDDGELPPAARETLLASAVRATGRIKRLATSLLDLDRVEAGLLRLDLADVDLRAAVRRSADFAGDPEARVDVPDGLAVRADPERLEQILVNLTLNAVRHGRPPVVISARRTAAAVEITVRDHGDGVGAGDAEGLFERFSGVDPGPDSVGLGLWIVRRLVEAHGGTVRYRRADPGASFVVTLPSADGGAAPRRSLRRSAGVP